MAPDRLRFDFSHHAAPTPRAARREVTELANADVLSDDAGRDHRGHQVRGRGHGALSFFDDKYGDVVRVVRAGPHSLEFCGGTHVDALGMIGPIEMVSEGSIGSNTRRIEAVTGRRALERALRRDSAGRRGGRAC